MTTLIELTAEFRALDDALTETGGEWTPEIEARFAALDASEAAKADGYGWILKALDAERTALKVIRDELDAKLTTLRHKSEGLKARVLAHLTETKKSELKGPTWRLAVTANGGAMPLVLGDMPPTAFPARLQRTVIEVDIDKVRAELAAAEKADAAALAGGLIVPERPADHVLRFAHFVERGSHLRVR